MASPGKYFRLLFHDAETRNKAWDFYIHWKNIYSMGESEIGFFRHVFGFQSLLIYYLAGDNVATKLGFNVELKHLIWLVPLLFLGKFMVYVLTGLLLDKNKLIHRHQKWHNKRNEMLMQIEKATSK